MGLLDLACGNPITGIMKFRPNVAAIIQNADSEILIARRTDFPECWQFPQGGIDEGETPEEAILREVKEEIDLDPESFEMLGKFGPYRYVFAEGRTRKGFDGQEQFYFLLKLKEDSRKPNPHTACPEFSELRWIRPEDFELSWVPDFKRAVYKQVLLDIFENPQQ